MCYNEYPSTYFQRPYGCTHAFCTACVTTMANKARTHGTPSYCPMRCNVPTQTITLLREWEELQVF